MDVKNDRNTIPTKNKHGIEADDIEGFAVWYLNSPPVSVNDFNTGFGYKSDYNGLGLFVFKHQGRWRILGVYNQGLKGLTVDVAVDKLSKSTLFIFNCGFCLL